MITKQEIERILNEHPTLNLSGFEKSPPYHARQLPRELPECVGGVSVAFDWLAPIEKTKGFNEHHSTYGMKHLFEEKTGIYVANGELIVAALLAGFATSRGRCSPRLNISERSLNARLAELRHNGGGPFQGQHFSVDASRLWTKSEHLFAKYCSPLEPQQ